MFYLFFPLAARFLGRTKWFLALLLAFVVAGPFARTIMAHGNEVWQEYSYLGGMDSIALGCLTALLVARREFSSRARKVQVAIGAVLLIFTLCFSHLADSAGLVRTALDMTVIAMATCLLIAAATQSHWKAPRPLAPLLHLGQHSYEIYLTHMFVVLALFTLFVRIGKPMLAVAPLFIAVTIVAALLGQAVARLYSEPLNSAIRTRWSAAKTS